MRSRRSPVGAVIAAALLGAVIAGVVVPDHATDVATGGVALTPAVGSPADIAGAPVDAGTSTDAGAPTDAGGAATPGTVGSGSSGGGAPAANPATPAAGGAAAGGSAAPAGGNGGATFRGVSDKEILIGVMDLDSSDLAPVCPRCDNGPSKEGGAAIGLVKAWERDGLLPINGRTIKLVFRRTTVTSPEQQRNGCVAFAQEVKPFLVVTGPGTGAAAVCLADEFKFQVMSAGQTSDEVLRAVYPNWVEVAPTQDRLLRNYAVWAKNNGLLDGKKVGIYSWEDEGLDRTANGFRAELKKLGVEPVIDMRASGTEGLGSTSASDAVAVQRFRGAGVEVAFLLTSALGFQSAAQAQAYRPVYPIVDTGYNHTDAVADVFVNADAMDGNLGYTPKQWVWERRKPATPAGNTAATYCLKAYSDYTKRTLDVFDNDAEIRYVQNICSAFQVLREGLAKAGPKLTQTSWLQGIWQLKNFATADFPSVSFSQSKMTGADVAATAQFKRARWPETNDYWKITSPFQPFTLQ